jgi:hypothetical protein
MVVSVAVVVAVAGAGWPVAAPRTLWAAAVPAVIDFERFFLGLTVWGEVSWRAIWH